MDPVTKRSITVGLLNMGTFVTMHVTGFLPISPFTFPLFTLVVLGGILWSLTLRILFGSPVREEDEDVSS